ncbi:MAG: glycosyltransferase [Thermoplasmatales archaeon]
MTSVYINGKMTEELHHVENDLPVILMHGNWGPQKNLELGLSSLRKLKQSGKNFKLIISGGINHHFPSYEKIFNDLIQQYSDVIGSYVGYVKEKDIMELFLQADLVMLPYNTPGGHSGVLEQAIFFEVPTVAISFPEYLEQATNSKNVLLSPKEEYEDNLKKLFNSFPNEKVIKAKYKISYCLEQLSVLVKSEYDG